VSKIQAQQIDGRHPCHGQLATRGATRGPLVLAQALPLAAALEIPIALSSSQAAYWLHQYKRDFFFFNEGLFTARASAKPPPPPLWGCAPGSNGPSGPLRRAQSRGPHRSRHQPTPLPGLRCGTRRRGPFYRMESGGPLTASRGCPTSKTPKEKERTGR
jgi:hypothetical protein